MHWVATLQPLLCHWKLLCMREESPSDKLCRPLASLRRLRGYGAVYFMEMMDYSPLAIDKPMNLDVALTRC